MSLTSARLPRWAWAPLLWAGLAVSTISLEAPYPATDVFLFKEPGVRLAEEGRLVASDLPHQPPGETRVYAYYPPVFPVAFGLWTRAFGLGVKRSLAFDLFVRTLRTLCLVLLLVPLARLGSGLREGIAGGVTLLLVGLCWATSDGDRPDELALAFGLVSAAALVRLRGRGRVLLSGLALGLCGATSPACGALFALAHAFWWAREGAFAALAAGGGIAATVFAGVNLPVYLADPEAFARFSKQAALSNFPYLEWLPDGMAAVLGAFGDAVVHSLRVAIPYVWAGLVVPVVACWLSRRASPSFPYRPFAWAALAYLPLSLVIWTLQPYYWWFAAVLGLAAGLAALPGLSARSQWLGLAAVVAGIFPVGFRAAMVYVHAWQAPPGERASEIAARVATIVPPEASLAVTPDQYLVFRPERRVANLAYACGRLDGYDYLYVSPRTARRDRWFPDPIPCFFHRECFEPLAQLSSREPLTFFGTPTSFFARGHGGTVYRNTRCPPGRPFVAGLKKPTP